MAVDLEIQLTRESRATLRRVAGAMRTHADGKVLRRELTRRLRVAAKPVAEAVKTEARALPAGGRKSTGLRKRIAAATGIQVKTGKRNPSVAVRVARARMGEQASLPRVTNEGRWRHPLFGNREKWVDQTSKRGWFDTTAEQIGRREVQQEMLAIMRDLEGRLS